MKGVRISIIGFIADEPRPGMVACELVDARGDSWLFQEKVPVVTMAQLDAASTYPQPGVIACSLLAEKHDANGQVTLVIDTAQPYGVESCEGKTQFEVKPTSLIEWS